MATADIYVQVPPAAAADGRPAQVAPLATPFVNLTNLDNTGVATWLWAVVDAPPGTTAALSANNVPAPTYGPLDAPGSYLLRLAVNGATGDWQTDAEVDQIVIRVRGASIGLIIPAIGETVEGGTSGWADWITCMNDNLERLETASTLQGVYDVSTPPRIAIAGAHGPLELREGVAAADLLRLSNSAGTTLGAWDNHGKLSLVLDALIIGEYALSVGASGAADGSLLRLHNAALGSSMLVGFDNSVASVAINAAASPAVAYDFDAQGAYGYIWQAHNSLGSGGDPIAAAILATGGLSLASKTAIRGLYVDAKAATTDVVRFDNSSNASQAFRVRNDGSVYARTVAAAANDGLEIIAPAFAGTNLFKAGDSTSGDYFRVRADARLEAYMEVPAGGDGVNLRFTSLDAAASEAFVLREAGGTIAFAISPSCLLYQKVDAFNAYGLGTSYGHWQSWDAASPILNGQTRNGFFVDGSTLAVNAGGTWYGFEVSLLGAFAGTAAAFRSLVGSQGVPAYKLGFGVADNPYVGFCRLSVADWNESLLDANPWVLHYAVATGAGSYWSAGTGSRYLFAPVHVPPGCTITGVKAHVTEGGAAAPMSLYLISTDAIAGAAADQQTQLATAASSGAGAEQDISIAGLAIAVPRGEAATQQAFYLCLVSGQAGDDLFTAQVQFEYSELLHGE